MSTQGILTHKLINLESGIRVENQVKSSEPLLHSDDMLKNFDNEANVFEHDAPGTDPNILET